MIEQSVSLASSGVIKVPGYEQLLRFGYTKNRGIYRLAVTATGEWEGLAIRAFWHVPGGSDPASSLVVDGSVDVPASVTVQPGDGCITFEGSDGTKTVTSADLRYHVSANSGTEDGTEPEPGTLAWEQLVGVVKDNADAAEQAKQDAQTAAAESAASANNAAASEKAAGDAQKKAAESLQELKDGIASGDFKGEQGPAGADGKDGLDAPQIDDAVVSAENPWSSRKIIETLCPPLEETGNPVGCYPVANYPLGVVASWEPVQEGSGEPSPDNIRPIKGRDSVTVERQEDSLALNLYLPNTIYGGSVDAVTGQGERTAKVITLDGISPRFYTSASGVYWNMEYNSAPGIDKIIATSHFAKTYFGVNKNYDFVFTDPKTMENLFASTDELNAYLAAQYAAGTPMQIIYKPVEPIPFTATGAQSIPALSGVNTLMTDADTLTVTGRADPIKRITDLETSIASMT